MRKGVHNNNNIYYDGEKSECFWTAQFEIQQRTAGTSTQSL